MESLEDQGGGSGVDSDSILISICRQRKRGRCEPDYTKISLLITISY